MAKWNSFCAYRHVTVQFESDEERERAIHLFWSDEELCGIPRVPLIGHNSVLLPDRAIPLLQKHNLRFAIRPNPKRSGGYFWLEDEKPKKYSLWERIKRVFGRLKS